MASPIWVINHRNSTFVNQDFKEFLANLRMALAWIFRSFELLLADSESHAPNVPLFREPPCGIGLVTRKTIAVQCSITKAANA